MKELSESELRQLDLALEANEETLFAVIGNIESQNQLGAAPPSEPTLIARGRSWFESKRTDFGVLLCGDLRIQRFRGLKDPHKEDIKEAVLLISDLILSVKGGIPVMYISSLIVKIGIDEICGGK